MFIKPKAESENSENILTTSVVYASNFDIRDEKAAYFYIYGTDKKERMA